MFKLTVRAVVAAAAGLMIAAGVAQTREIVRSRTQGPSSADLGTLLGLNGWDLTVQGARIRSMGGACLALSGDDGNLCANPGALGFLLAPQLTAESRYQFGSSSGSQAPTSIVTSSGQAAPVSNFIPGVTNNYSYNNISYGMPILLLGHRAGVRFAYRRMQDFDNGEETRFRVRVEQGQADLGVGLNYRGGIDAFSPALAFCVNDRLSLGAGLNFMTGKIEATGDEGVTSFGAVVVSGDLAYRQNVYGTSLDLGAQYKVRENLTLGGVLQPGHDIGFKDGWELYHPLADYMNQDAPDLYMERDLLDHTLSVPTMYGAGIAYHVDRTPLLGGRLTLAADYWNRAWSKASVTQDSLYATVEYRVPITPDAPISPWDSVMVHVTDVSTTRNAHLKDTHHFRIGAEWMLKDSDTGGLRIPIRVGFRREPRTYSNADTTAYNQKIFRPMVAAAADSSTSALTALVNDLYRNGSSYLVGSKVPATIVTFGTGLSYGSFSLDFAVSHTTFAVDRIFLGAFTDITQYRPGGMATGVLPVREDRSVNEVSITTTLKF